MAQARKIACADVIDSTEATNKLAKNPGPLACHADSMHRPGLVEVRAVNDAQPDATITNT
jgi:hypothetical protein